MEAPEQETLLAPIRELPFVREVSLHPGRSSEAGSRVKIRSVSGVTSFTADVRRSYLGRPALAGIAATSKRLERDKRPPLLVLARHVPRAAGEELARAGICFADESGNVNIRLGERYHALVLGNRDLGRMRRARRLSPGAVQLLFVALARPELLRAPVRQLAENAGIGKSTAGEVRKQLLQERLIVRNSSGDYQVTDEKTIRERFLLGYSQVLRPHLLIGRYRGPYRDGSRFVTELGRACSRRSARWTLTGAAGAYELDRFYRSGQTVVFVDAWGAGLAKELRLIPDMAGPITALRPFGSLMEWPHPAKRPVAHPWLIYAELLHDGDPRAIEAAEELLRNHLT